MDFKQMIQKPEYDFLRDNPHLGKNIILLGLGGSHAYGTNIETSDVDVRGVALNSKSEIIGLSNFEQVVNSDTDTTIYSFKKMVSLLCECNPNVIEILGFEPEGYIYLGDEGEKLLSNREMFLSQRAAFSFGGYAKDQLRRLENKSSHVSQEARERQIQKSLEFAYKHLAERYGVSSDGVKFHIGESEKEDFENEIFIDVNLKDYPLRNFNGLMGELTSIVRNCDKNSLRTEKAIGRNKLAKHQMHLIRLYLMGIDILRDGKIVTRRDVEHDLLMNIRNGCYLNEDNTVTKDFSELLMGLEADYEDAILHTILPKHPDMKKVENFVMSINERIVTNGI